MTERPVRCADYDKNKSEVTDNSLSNPQNNKSPKNLSPLIVVLGIVWIVMPDLIPGCLDDLLVFLFMVCGNSGIANVAGHIIRDIFIMIIMLWITSPDFVPGPFDDLLLLIILINLLSNKRKK